MYTHVYTYIQIHTHVYICIYRDIYTHMYIYSDPDYIPTTLWQSNTAMDNALLVDDFPS